MKVCIVIPTINEIEGLKKIVSKIKKEWYTRLIILDGGSKDGTIQYAREKNYEVIVQKRPGIKMAYTECYPTIKEDIIITLSPDGNSIVDAIPLLVKKIREGYDMVIASRYKDNAISYDDTKITRFGNWVFTTLISFFGYRYTDAMVMYRAYRKDVPKKLKLTKIRSNWWEQKIGRFVSWEPLMSIRAAKAKLKIAEIPVDEPNRLDEKYDKRALPTSRTSHYKAAVACFIQLLEEAIKWKI